MIMQKYLLPLFLSSAFILSSVHGMEKNNPLESNPSAGHRLHTMGAESQQAHRPLRKGMIVATQDTEKGERLTFFGDSYQPVFECDVPFKDIRCIRLTRDGTLYILGGSSYVFLKKGILSEPYAYGGSISLPHHSIVENTPDGSLYVRGYDSQEKGVYDSQEKGDYDSQEKGALMVVKEDQVIPLHLGNGIQSNGIQSIEKMVAAPDGSLYVRGQNSQWQNGILVHVKGDQVFPLHLDNGIQSIENMVAASDGSLYVLGRNSQWQNRILVRMKGDQVFPLHLGERVQIISHMVAVPDGSVYGRVGRPDDLVRVKGDQVIPLHLSEALKSITNMVAASDGSVYVWGYDPRMQSICVHVKGDQVIPLHLSEALKSISYMVAGPNGSVYVRGENSQGQYVLVCIEGETVSPVPTMAKVPALYSLEGEDPLFPLLRQEKAAQIFSDTGVNEDSLNTLCQELESYPSQYFTSKEGEAFYKFFIPHISHFLDSEKASASLYRVLTLYTAQEADNPMYGYALALYFEGSRLEEKILTYTPEMSEESLLHVKQEPDFQERLKATNEAKEMLMKIVQYTPSEFSEPYKRLLEKVDAAFVFVNPPPPLVEDEDDVPQASKQQVLAEHAPIKK